MIVQSGSGISIRQWAAISLMLLLFSFGKAQDTCFKKTWTNEIAPNYFGEGIWDFAYQPETKSFLLVGGELSKALGDSIWSNAIQNYVIDSNFVLQQKLTIFERGYTYAASSVVNSNAGNFLASGERGGYMNGGVVDPVLWKFNPYGDTIWQKVFSYDDSYCSFRSAIELPNGEIVAAGNIQTVSGFLDLFLMKTNADGEVIRVDSIGKPYITEYCQIVFLHFGGLYIMVSWWFVLPFLSP